MQDFEENKQFVRRTSTEGVNIPSSEIRRPQTPPTRAPMQNTGNRSGGQINTKVQNGGVARPQSAQMQNRTQPQGQRQSAPRPQNVRRPMYDVPKRTPAIKKQKEGGESFLLNALIFVAMLVGLLAIGLLFITTSLRSTAEKAPEAYTVIYGDEDTTAPTLISGNSMYLNMSSLAKFLNFTVSGDKNNLRYEADETEYIEFTVSSNSAVINGDGVVMSASVIEDDEGDIFIPADFVEEYFFGLEISKDEEKLTYTITREETNESTDEKPVYEKITFKVKGSISIGNVTEDPDFGEIAPPTFSTDLSEYEEYMNPADRDAFLILVNKTEHIDSTYLPENLISVENTRKDRAKEQMVEYAAKALEAMFIELKAAGYTDVSVTSAYRSYNKQTSLFNTYLAREMANNPALTEEEARNIVLTYSAYPGTSEHQTGLCCDMHNLSSADVKFAEKEAYTWLKENCHNFGFIIRFPEDKTEITGYSFEPWHYRYVGRFHATRMNKLGMCLEEYIEYLEKADENE